MLRRRRRRRRGQRQTRRSCVNLELIDTLVNALVDAEPGGVSPALRQETCGSNPRTCGGAGEHRCPHVNHDGSEGRSSAWFTVKSAAQRSEPGWKGGSAARRTPCLVVVIISDTVCVVPRTWVQARRLFQM